MTRNLVNWFEIYVQDIERAKRFYSAVLGVTFTSVTPDVDMWAFPGGPDAPGSNGALVKAGGMPSGGNSTLVYFSCEDCGIEGSRVAAAGGRVVRDKLGIGQYGFIVLATDTEGNMFGLHSPR